MTQRHALSALALIFLLVGLTWAGLPATNLEQAGSPAPAPPANAGEVITAPMLHGHTAFLADDLLEGRAPASRGGDLAAKYIAAQFARLGLEPIGPDASYFQNVPMVGRTITTPADLRVGKGDEALSFKYLDDFVPTTDSERQMATVEGELVFVGYGIVAPEYRWDDFKGVDVKGKILLGLVNDPPATAAEPELFGARALTYYGRWTYKYEEAARQGAAGAILIHTTESAGYPFQVLQASGTGEQFDLPRGPDDLPPLGLKAWITETVARKILALAGQDFDALVAAAAARSFRPVPLELTASTNIHQGVRHIESPNVIGVLPGADPKLSDEYVIYTAHYDHLGMNPDIDGDGIFNGAADNAVGVAGLLGIAEAMVALPEGSKRTQVFAAVTAEEQGLLGSAYYARHPLVPPAQTVANINMDGLNQWGATRDIVLIGSGKSELDDLAQLVADRHQMKLLPDQFPEKGFFYRSDQFNLAKVGIPALYFDNGLDVLGQPPGYGKAKFEEYTAKDYHQPSDEIKPDWDWGGAVQMARYIFECGWLAANWEREFHWAPNAEFRAAREESLQKAKEKQ
jgi:Zn-dependent M28 family amino/carboxypeptidase